MSKWILLENLKTYDNLTNKMIKGEPDLYINQYAQLKLFLNNNYFEHLIKSLNVTTVHALISPSVPCCDDETLDEYVEMLAEPVHALHDDAPEELCYLITENRYYMKKSLFSELFENSKLDILVD